MREGKMLMFACGCVLAALCLFVPISARAATYVQVTQTISTSTVWRAASSPYIVQGLGRLPVTGQLTVEPGVVVKFESASMLWVRPGGQLLADGTEAAPIIFTSYHDDVGGNTDNSSIGPQAGDWYGMLFDGDTSSISHAYIRYAGASYYSGQAILGGVEVRNHSRLRLTHTILSDHRAAGLAIIDTAEPVISFVTIENNTGYGIYSTVQSAAPMIADTTIRNNTNGVIEMSVANTIRFARMNFGGTTPQIVDFGTDTTTIRGEAVWPYLPSLVYIANRGTFYVASGAALTIEPGVAMKWRPLQGLYVQGTLTAVGTDDLPIIFTSYLDSTVGGNTAGPTAGSPAANDWGGIYLDRGSVGSLSHAVLRYGGTMQGTTPGTRTLFTQQSSLALRETSANVEYLTVDSGSGPAIYVSGTSTIRLEHSSIVRMANGIDVYNNGALVARNNSFVSTTGYAIRNNSRGIVDAVRNWWGDDSGPWPVGRGGRIVGPTGAATTSTVLYDPWIGRHDPVILVPGILGSEIKWADTDYIRDPESLFFGDILWPNINRMIGDRGDNFMDELMSDSNGVPLNNSIVVGSIVRRPITFFDYTEGLIHSLTTTGYIENTNLFVFPYDWRLDVKTNSDRLSTFIQEHATSTGKVDIVAHSMGGLVVKQYMADHPASSTIDTLVFIGTPHLGAPGAAKTLLFGDDLDISFATTVPLLGREFKASFLSEQEIKKISRNMPAIYQLLPSREYVARTGGFLYDYLLPGVPLNYDQGQEFLDNHNLNTSLLARADQFHSTELDNMVFPSDMNVFNISGCREATVGSVVRRYHDPYNTGNFSQPEHFEYYLGYVPGDATVPLASSDAPNLPRDHRFFVTETSHGTMPSQQDIRELAVDLIRHPQAQPIVPNSILQSSGSCRLRGRQITTHSPVDIHVYDSLGNHVGPNPDGSVDMGIPGVSYDNLDNNKFVFLPENNAEQYRVELRATATGTFNMRVVDIQNDVPVQTVYYNAVPIVAASKASVVITSSTGQGSVSLSLDHDGSDVYQVIPATSVLNSTSSLDFTAPETVAVLTRENSFDPIVGMTSSSVTVNLSATDSVSGVLRTEYSIDGGTSWTVYTGSFVADREGVQVWYRSIDQAGNIEEAKTVSIPIDQTPPVPTAYFDLNVLDFVFTGVDNSSSSVQAIYTTASATSTVRFSDTAENSTEIEYTSASTTNNMGYFTRTLRMRNMRVNNGNWAALDGNQLLALWTVSPTGTLRSVQLSFQLKSGLYLIAQYSVGTDESIWWQKNSGGVREEIGRYVGNKLFSVQLRNLSFIY